MVNIALLTHNNGGGGAALAVSRLAKGLVQSSQPEDKFNFTLLASVLKDKDFAVKKKQIGGSFGPKNSIAREFLYIGIEKMWSYMHRTRKDPRFFCMQGLRDIRDDLKEFDIVNMFWMQTLADLSKLAQNRRPKVITLHDMWFLTGGCSYSFGCEKYRIGCTNCEFMWAPFARDASKQYHAKEKILSNDKTRVVVTSKWMYNAAIARGIEDSKISMIKNYTPDNYHFFGNKAMARELLGINSNLKHKFILYFIGSAGDPRKGFDLFCDAIILLSSYLQKEIVVMHLGPVDTSYDALLEDNGIDMVHLGSFVDEVPQIIAYNAADYLICPSRYDNTPNVIAEAHMCGLPVITSSKTGAAEMIREHENGMTADVENAEEFAHTLTLALTNDDFAARSSISSQARLTYGYQATCHNYMNLYRSML